MWQAFNLYGAHMNLVDEQAKHWIGKEGGNTKKKYVYSF